MLTWRILGRLLDYPSAELITALPELRRALAADDRLPRAHLQALDGLIAELGRPDLLARQEAYVALFDRSRRLSLHLFEHLHGDSRERGEAMLALVKLYEQHGFDVSAKELPDFLPLLLEFASLVEPRLARALLADAAHILHGLHGRLRGRGSAYAAVLGAVLHLAGERPGTATIAPVPDEDSFETLDREWAEAAVAFGPDTQSPLTGAQAAPPR